MIHMPTFLLIDDQQASLDATQAAIREVYPDAFILTSMSGPEALTLTSSVSIDLIILDIIMPGMDGFEVCRTLKADKTLMDVPVVFLTGSEQRREYRLLALEAGGEAYLTSPIDMTEFTIMLRIMLKLRQANLERRSERERLEQLVEQRTEALERELRDRLEYEARLQATEEIFESLFKATNAGKSVTRISGEVNANQAFYDMIGYSHEEMKGKTWQELTPEEDIERVTQMLAPLLSGERSDARFEKRYIHKSGKIVWADVSTVLMRGPDGQPKYFITTIVDITERVRAAQLLAASEERYRTVVEQAGDALFIYGIDGKFIEVNRQACECLQYTREELLQLSVPDVETEYVEETSRALREAMKPQDLHTVTGIQRRKDGTTFPVEVRVGTCSVDGRKLFIAIVRDVTERLTNETALRQSESRLKEVSVHSKSLVWEVDPCGLYTYYSENCDAIVGWKCEEIVGEKHFYDLTPEEDRAELMETAFRVFDKQMSFVNFENRILTKDGEYVWMSTNGFPLYNSDGEFIGYRGSDTDITKRKLAEEKVQRSYELLQRLTDRVPGVVYQYLLRPDGSSCFPISSRGMWDIYNVTPEEVREDATPVFGRLHPEDFDHIVETIMASARDLTSYHSEFRVVLPEGGVQWRMCDAEPERTEDGGTLWYGIITDITTRRAMEEELRAAKDRAEVNDRLKSAFLMNMSHEIRTPLNGILGCLELIAEPDVSSEDRDQLIDIINRSGRRLMNTIEDILEISRIESGETKVSRVEVSISEVFTFLTDFFRSQAAEKNLSLYVSRCDGPCIDLVYTDKHMFESILINLIRNAIKFTTQGSIEFGCQKRDDSITFYVRDSGPGIPPDKIDAVFERFVQANAESNRNRQHEGTGLGLLIVKSHLELLGGHIWVESEVGKGSTFWFSIPIAPPEPIQIDLEMQSSPFPSPLPFQNED